MPLTALTVAPVSDLITSGGGGVELLSFPFLSLRMAPPRLPERSGGAASVSLMFFFRSFQCTHYAAFDRNLTPFSPSAPFSLTPSLTAHFCATSSNAMRMRLVMMSDSDSFHLFLNFLPSKLLLNPRNEIRSWPRYFPHNLTSMSLFGTLLYALPPPCLPVLFRPHPFSSVS